MSALVISVFLTTVLALTAAYDATNALGSYEFKDPHGLLIPVHEFKEKYRYSVTSKKLGKGGGGSVVLGKFADNPHKKVAIKITRKVNQNEVQSSLVLRHERIVPVYNIAIDGKTVLIAMEAATTYGSLDKILKKKSSLDAQSLKTDLRAITVGLEYIHSQNWTHRDLKP